MLTDSYPLGPLTLANRLIVAPMCMYSANEGVPGAFHDQHLGRLALSGAGMVIIEATGVSPQGRITDRCLGLWNDTQEEALRQLLGRVRTYSSTPIAIQIGHAGRKASTSAPWINRGAPLSDADGAWPVVGPSALAFKETWPTPQALDEAGMAALIEDFVACAKRADRAGFDALELHAAHGYLLSSFLSPVANQRTDAYGGSLSNRMHFPLQVAEAVRAVWPKNKALGARFNGSDWSDQGITPQEAAQFGAALSALGYDWLHVSSGGNDATARISAQSAYQLPFAAQVKAANPDTAVIGVGLIKSAKAALAPVVAGDVDLIAVGRAVLDNPNWPHHVLAEVSGFEDLPHPYERADKAWRERAAS
jgi:2,4-dienoyl-CoA reductase-like NADH-dependent reductase (Old Yellow Enzyme family)